MKKLLCYFAALAVAVSSLQAQTDVVVQIHFLGGDKISTDTSHLGFTNEFCSAEAKALENQTLDKLSAAPAIWFKSKLPTGAIDCSKQLRPLLDDLLTSEWIFEMRDATNGSPEYALAIRLGEQRTRLWSTNLRTLIESWTMIRARDTANGWRLKKDMPPNLFQFSRKGDWVVLDCGQNELPLGEEIVKSTGTAETNWLTAEVNWPRLAQLYPAFGRFDLPQSMFEVIGEHGTFIINGKLHLSQPLPAPAKWRVPTDEISQPFESFTAVRGLAPWLEKQSWYHLFDFKPQPDQFFAWELPKIPFQTYAAAPVPDAGAALGQISKNLTANTNWQDHFIPIKLEVKTNQILFHALFITPTIQTTHGPEGDYISAGFFPIPPGSGPLPAQLQDQLSPPGVVYYNWEMTSKRLQELPGLTQFILLILQKQQLGSDSAGYKWLNKIASSSEVTVTTATEAAPDEINFVRTGPDGLTAIELIALANWLDSPDFPSLSIPKAQDQ
ncbi:MAG TPA: hypothetical protein VGN23_13105 [Verrucomicrobiae bacterium]|jgi:hypothetical protein